MYKNTLILYFRTFVTLFISLFTSRITLEALGVVDFGIFNVVGGIVALLAFITQTLTVSFQRFLCLDIAKDDNSGQQTTIGAALLLMTSLTIVIVILCETAGIWLLRYKINVVNTDYSTVLIVYHCSIACFIINLFRSIYNSIIVSTEKMTAYAYICIIEVLTKCAIAYILFLAQTNRLELYVYLTLINSTIIFLTYYIYCRLRFPQLRPSFRGIRAKLRKLTSFCMYGIVGSMSHIIKFQSLNIILNLFGGPVLNAARAISIQVYSALNSFITNFQTAFSPYMIKQTTLSEQRSKSSIYSFSWLSFHIVVLLFTPVIFNTDIILSLWLGNNVPPMTASFIQIVLLMGVFDALSSPLINIIYGNGKIKILQIFLFVINIGVIPITFVCMKHTESPIFLYLLDLIAVFLCYGTRIYIATKYNYIILREYASRILIPTSLVLLTISGLFSICCYFKFFSAITISIVLEFIYLSICIFKYRFLIKGMLSQKFKHHKQ